jgi:phosphatidylglycerol---prolipoprotein diacylglyceryl transferase
MLPVLLEIGGFRITSFGASIAVAFLVAAWMISRELRRRGDDPDVAWDLAGWAAICGILGAKAYYLVLHLPNTAADPVAALTSRSGLVWYGGFIGGALGVIFRLRRLDRSVLRTADAVAPGLAVGYVIGRLGCFLVGDDYGRPSTVPWAVEFPQGAPPSTAGNLRAFGVEVPAGVPDERVLAVHPTQLYESGATLVILAVLVALRPRVAGTTGALWFAFLAMLGAERFVVEIFRAKDDRLLGAFSIAQLISVGLIVVGVWMVLSLRSRPGTARPEAVAA